MIKQTKKYAYIAIFAIVFLAAPCVQAQYKGLDIGILPYGTTTLEAYVRRDVLFMANLTGDASISSPAYRMSYNIHNKKRKLDRMHEIIYQELKMKDLDNNKYNVYYCSYLYSLGYTILYGRRLQFPLYCGVGLGIYTGQLEDFYGFLDFSLKARVKFYITNRLSLYAGYGATWGYDLTTKTENKENVYVNELNPNPEPIKDTKGSEKRTFVETGLIIDF